MATLSSLVETIAGVEGVDPLQVSWIARQLREAEFIRKGGRGRGGARMTPEDAVNLLIGVNATGSPKEAVQAVKTFRSLVWEPNERFTDRTVEADREDPFRSIFRTRVTFEDVLGKLILMSVPQFKPTSELEEVLNREHLEIEIEFVRPVASVDVRVFYYSRPTDEEDLGEYWAAEDGSFVLTAPQLKPDEDRTDRVRITHKTILEVGKVLAS
jgi:hypothetical protein